MGALILNELTQMRRDNSLMLEKVVRIEETVRDVGDHESRLRVLEASIPDEVKVRLNALERWRWTAMGALSTSGISIGVQVYNTLKGVS
jgi:hypothetical protein